MLIANGGVTADRGDGRTTRLTFLSEDLPFPIGIAHLSNSVSFLCTRNQCKFAYFLHSRCEWHYLSFACARPPISHTGWWVINFRAARSPLPQIAHNLRERCQIRRVLLIYRITYGWVTQCGRGWAPTSTFCKRCGIFATFQLFKRLPYATPCNF